MDRADIDRYAAGATAPAEAIAGLSKSELLATPIPGTWSIQQIVLHLMDSDLIGSDRMKRVVAEDCPRLLGYNETLFAARLHYADADVGKACDVFRLNRELTSDLLRRLPDEAFAMQGDHSENGLETLAYLVTAYADHLDGHLEFIRKKRDLLGNPLPA